MGVFEEDMGESMKKFRFIYLPDYGWCVAQILSNEHYEITGNGSSFEIKGLKSDWGKKAKWGKLIKERPE